MTKRKRQVSEEDNVTVLGSNKRSLTSGEEETDYFGSLTIDLIFKILSKLSVKPMAKCRCVSKLWSSIIRRPNYDQLFPVKSLTTPRILLAGIEFRSFTKDKLLFYSARVDKNPSSSLEVTPHVTSSVLEYRYKLCCNVGGFVCCQHFEGNQTWAVISNPITGEYVTTPKVTTEGARSDSRFYFGYDPIKKQFKVVYMTQLPFGSYKYQILTLGTVNLLWRNLLCCTIHYPLEDDNGICINGVLYYTATIIYMDSQKRVIVCFDVRSEKFSIINIMDDYLARKIREPLFLIDYKGKLGAIHFARYNTFFVLMVLEDAGEHKWSEHTYFFPDKRLESAGAVFTVGMVGSGEIGFYPHYGSNPFSMYYYSLETNKFRYECVVLPMLDWIMVRGVHTFPNFVEDVKLL